MVNSESAFEADKHLRRKDIFIYPWGIALLIRWTKSNQVQSKDYLTPLPRLRNNLLCPVQAIVNCMKLSLGASPVGPALTYRTNHRLKPLIYDRFVARVRQCYLPVAYLPHSLPLIRFVGVVPRIVMQLVYLQIALSLLVTGQVLAI